MQMSASITKGGHRKSLEWSGETNEPCTCACLVKSDGKCQQRSNLQK